MFPFSIIFYLQYLKYFPSTEVEKLHSVYKNHFLCMFYEIFCNFNVFILVHTRHWLQTYRRTDLWKSNYICFQTFPHFLRIKEKLWRHFRKMASIVWYTRNEVWHSLPWQDTAVTASEEMLRRVKQELSIWGYLCMCCDTRSTIKRRSGKGNAVMVI